MTSKLIRSILGSGRPSGGVPGSKPAEAGRPRSGRIDLPEGWVVVERGREPNVYEPTPDEHGVRVVPPHLDVAVLVQPVFVDGVFEQRVWQVALQAKRRFWDTGDEYIYETLWEEWFDSRREVDTRLEAVTADLAAATDVSDLHLETDSMASA